MKIIDAVWEKENIGVNAKEIQIEYEDQKQDVLRLLNTVSADYVVVKVPSDYETISFELAEKGYVFIETMHQLENRLVLKPINQRKQEIVAQTDFVPMTEDDFLYMCYKIETDCMFQTDRIARDPHFSLELANHRYVNWLKSERERGANLYQYIYQGHRIGFDCFREIEPGVYDDFLSGIYSEFAGKGLSVNITHKLHNFVVAHDGKKIITNIASTNVRSLSHHINNGYTITSSNYIFVKHSR